MVFLGITSVANLGFEYFVIGFVVLQITNSLLTGSWQVIGSDLAPEGARGRFFAVGRTVTQAGFATNPAAFAVLTSFSGFTLALGTIGTAGILSAVVLGLFVPETHKIRGNTAPKS